MRKQRRRTCRPGPIEHVRCYSRKNRNPPVGGQISTKQRLGNPTNTSQGLEVRDGPPRSVRFSFGKERSPGSKSGPIFQLLCNVRVDSLFRVHTYIRRSVLGASDGGAQRGSRLSWRIVVCVQAFQVDSHPEVQSSERKTIGLKASNSFEGNIRMRSRNVMTTNGYCKYANSIYTILFLYGHSCCWKFGGLPSGR